jgi:hypothetical protein
VLLNSPAGPRLFYLLVTRVLKRWYEVRTYFFTKVESITFQDYPCGACNEAWLHLRLLTSAVWMQEGINGHISGAKKAEFSRSRPRGDYEDLKKWSTEAYSSIGSHECLSVRGDQGRDVALSDWACDAGNPWRQNWQTGYRTLYKTRAWRRGSPYHEVAFLDPAGPAQSTTPCISSFHYHNSFQSSRC